MHTTISVSKKSGADSYNLVGTVLMDVNAIGEYMAKSSAVKWTITSGDASSADGDTCPSGSTILNSGNFNGVSEDDTIELYSPFEVTTSEKQFTVWIWIDSNEAVSPNLTGETLDVEVYTQIDQIVEDRFVITKISNKYQTIYATVINSNGTITSYGVNQSSSATPTWTTIPDGEQGNVYNLEYDKITTADTYYVWFIDENDKTVNKSITITSIDDTPPVCTIEGKDLEYGTDGVINVSCTDSESGIYYQKLTTSNFESSNTSVATISSVSDPVAITNGYKYTLTIHPISVGTYNLSIKAGAIYDDSGNTNILTTNSEQIVVSNYAISLDGQDATTQNTSTLYGKYNDGIYLDSSYATLMTTSSNNITIPVKTGYTFGGYYTETNGSGTQMIDENGYLTSSFTSTTYNANTTWYAKWTISSYTLTVNPNGGTYDGSTSNKTYTQNYNTTKVLGSPSANAAYTITYDANSQGATYTGSPTSVARLFSSWTITSGSGSLSSGTYTYGAGNGTVTANYNTTSSSFTLPTISKTGYTCKWAEGSASGTQYAGGTARTITGNKTYYAVCSANNYTVTANANGGTIL